MKFLGGVVPKRWKRSSIQTMAESTILERWQGKEGGMVGSGSYHWEDEGLAWLIDRTSHAEMEIERRLKAVIPSSSHIERVQSIWYCSEIQNMKESLRQSSRSHHHPRT